MAVELANAAFRARIAETGAELKSLRDLRTGTEHLWGGDEVWWSGSAPVLFPIIGGLKDGRYRYEGREYELPQHGFARRSVFQVVQQSAAAARLELRADAGTRRVYPFEFTLSVQFTLTETGIAAGYEVRGGGGRMYFSIGSHPAFCVPFAGGYLENYYIHFGEEEHLERYFFQDGLVLEQTAPVFDNSRQIFLNRKIFERGVLIFKKPASRDFSIRNSRNFRQVRLVTDGVPYLGIWSKPGAPFVCLEPWHGLPDSPKSDQNLVTKEGILSLEAGGVFRTGYRIEIL